MGIRQLVDSLHDGSVRRLYTLPRVSGSGAHGTPFWTTVNLGSQEELDGSVCSVRVRGLTSPV